MSAESDDPKVVPIAAKLPVNKELIELLEVALELAKAGDYYHGAFVLYRRGAGITTSMTADQNRFTLAGTLTALIRDALAD